MEEKSEEASAHNVAARISCPPPSVTDGMETLPGDPERIVLASGVYGELTESLCVLKNMSTGRAASKEKEKTSSAHS